MAKNTPEQAFPADEIPTSRFELTEFDDPNDYLSDPFNYDMYQSERYICEGYYPLDDGELLRMFQGFYKSLVFVKANLNKPLLVEKQLAWYGNSMIKRLSQYADLLAEDYGKTALRDSLAMAHLREMQRQSDAELRQRVSDLYNCLDSTATESTPKKVVKARRRDVPANRIGLFFFYLFEATGSNGTREDKAKVVSVLTNFSESTIKGMLSNPLAEDSKDTFADDFRAVMGMFKRIGFSTAYDLMNRDRTMK